MLISILKREHRQQIILTQIFISFCPIVYTERFHTSFLATHAEKRPSKRPVPSNDSNDSSSCGEEAVEGPSMGKGGDKKVKLAKKKKVKKMEKENDLVGSSQGSDSQLSEAEDK